MKRLQAGDIDYKEASAASAIRNKFEVDGIKAEQNAAVLKVCPRAKKSMSKSQLNFNNCYEKVIAWKLTSDQLVRAQCVSIFFVS